MVLPQSPVNLSAVTLHLSYHTSVMLVHRPFLRHSEDIPEALRRLALSSTNSSAVAFVKLIRSADVAANMAKLPFFVVHHALTAGICHLFNATSNNPRLRRTSGRAVKSCAEAIEALAKRWHVRAEQALKVLRELAARWKVVWALPMHLSYPVAQDETEEMPGSDLEFGHDMILDDLLGVDPETYGMGIGPWAPSWLLAG